MGLSSGSCIYYKKGEIRSDPGHELDSQETWMSEKPLKRYLFASDFDRTLTFN